MSEDLVKRLRTPVGFQDLPFIQEEAADRIEQLEERLENEMQDLDAADRRAKRLQNRIEELEAKMAKAVEKLLGAAEQLDGYVRYGYGDEFREAVAELTGGKND